MGNRILFLMTIGLLWTGGLHAQVAQQDPSAPSANGPSQASRIEDVGAAEVERLNRQVMALYGEGRYQEALSIASQALAIQEKSLPSGQLELAQALHNLATLFQALGQLGKAEPLFQRALAIRERALGPEHLAVASSLNNLALLYHAQARPEAAEPLYRRALAIREKALGPDDLAVASTMNSLGLLYNEQNRHAEAMPLLRRALAIREKALDPAHPDVAASLNNLGSVYKSQGQFAAAEPLLKRALSIFDKTLGPEDPDLVVALTNLASLYDDEGRYAAAEPLLKRGLEILEKALGPEHLHVAVALNNLGTVYSEEGRDTAAEPLLKRALAIREKVSGSEHPNVALSLQSLGSLYIRQARYGAAEPLLKRALAIWEKALGPKNHEAAYPLTSLALLYSEQGKPWAAEPLYRRALAIEEEALGPEHPDVAKVLNNLATIYIKEGQDSAAVPLLARALAIWEKALGSEHPVLAAPLNALASIYARQEMYAPAEKLYKRALVVREHALGTEHPDVAISLNNLGAFYGAQSRYTAAEPLLKRALAIWEQVLGPEHPNVASALDNLASLYGQQGEYAVAEKLYRRELAIQEKVLGSEHPDVADTLNNLATVRWSIDDIPAAVDLASRAAEIQEHNLSNQLGTGAERQKRQYLDLISGTMDADVTLHLRAAPSDSKAARLALTTVLQRKGRSLDAMSDQIGSLRRHLTPPDRVTLDELAVQRNRLASLILKGPGSGDGSAYRLQILSIEEKAQELEKAIAARSLSFAAHAQPVTIDRVRRALPTDGALVELVSYRTFQPKARSAERWEKFHYAAYVMMSSGEIRSVDLGEARALDRAIGDFGEALGNPGAFDALAVKRAGRALDQLVMRPVRALLGKVTRLFIAPDSELNLLPFAALVDEEGRYLVERFSITYLTSGRDLLRMQDGVSSRSMPLIVANPAFDLGGTSTVALAPAVDGTRGRRSGDLLQRWDPLTGTIQEAAAMKKLLSQVQVLEGREATESALKRVAGPQLLHIATHGFFLPDEPAAPPSARAGTLADKPGNPAAENPLLRSGLVLAGANARNDGGGEDGILTALEAAGLDLWGTKLVVLSACETGLGQARSGDGVYGLRRSLVLAGAESQLTSLWQVDDKVTRDLMVAYYGRLLAGEGRSEALRQVQLDMLKQPELQHPYYWAAFIPLGNWRTLNGRDR